MMPVVKTREPSKVAQAALDIVVSQTLVYDDWSECERAIY